MLFKNNLFAAVFTLSTLPRSCRTYVQDWLRGSMYQTHLNRVCSLPMKPIYSFVFCLLSPEFSSVEYAREVFYKCTFIA